MSEDNYHAVCIRAVYAARTRFRWINNGGAVKKLNILYSRPSSRNNTENGSHQTRNNLHVRQFEDELFTETKKGQLNLIVDEGGFSISCGEHE